MMHLDRIQVTCCAVQSAAAKSDLRQRVPANPGFLLVDIAEKNQLFHLNNEAEASQKENQAR